MEKVLLPCAEKVTEEVRDMRNNNTKKEAYISPVIEIIDLTNVHTLDVSAFDGEEHSFDFMTWLNS